MQVKELIFSHYSDFLRPRSRHLHKGDCGHVLMIGGEVGYSGAVRLAAEAAYRVGAGLVSVVTHENHVSVLNQSRPEIMCHTVEALQDLIDKATVIVLGPGLGRTDWSKKIFTEVIQTEKPLLVDADGLNELAEKPVKKSDWILTPHPGEASRLLKQTTADVQQDRIKAIEQLQKKYGGVIVLKGAGTLVLSHDAIPLICTQGNPGMATAGMGDVLSGVIAGLLAQGASSDLAAKLGVMVHAMAGDMAARDGERGMMASDVMPYLRNLVNP